MVAATLKFSATLSKSDPQTNPVLIVGQPKNLAKITFEQVQNKLVPRVNNEVQYYICTMILLNFY